MFMRDMRNGAAKETHRLDASRAGGDVGGGGADDDGDGGTGCRIP